MEYKNKEYWNLEVTTTETPVELKVKKISSIFNYGDQDLLYSIDKPFDEAGNGYGIIPAGLSGGNRENEEEAAGIIYLKVLSGTTKIQIVGFKDYAAHK